MYAQSRAVWIFSLSLSYLAVITTQTGVIWDKLPCGGIKPQPRIINGLRVPVHRYPWVVLVQARDERVKLTGICGGALVSHKHVLTAGHCLFLQGKRAPKMTVLYGHATLALAKRVSVISTILHPDYYDQTLKNDIALLELSRDLAFSENVQPVCLPDHDFPPLSQLTGIVAGWGYTAGTGKQRRHPFLLFVTQKIMPQDFCEAKMQGYFYSPETMFCAYRYSYDACQGDSGGGLMVLHENRWYIAGIISYGIGCGTPEVPGIYTDVTKYIGWLKAQLKNEDRRQAAKVGTNITSWDAVDEAEDWIQRKDILLLPMSRQREKVNPRYSKVPRTET